MFGQLRSGCPTLEIRESTVVNFWRGLRSTQHSALFLLMTLVQLFYYGG